MWVPAFGRNIAKLAMILFSLGNFFSCDKMDISKIMPDRDKSRYFENEKPIGDENPSFGEQLFYVLYHDIDDDLPDGITGKNDYDPSEILAYREARKQAFWAMKDEFTAAANATAGGHLLDPLQEPGDMGCRKMESALECSLRSMLDKIDDGTLPRLSRTAARLLRDLLDRERPGEEDRIAAVDENGNQIPDWIEDVLYLKNTNLMFTRRELVELFHQYFSYDQVYEFLHELARLARGLDVDEHPNHTGDTLPELLDAVGEELAGVDVDKAVMSIDTELLEKVVRAIATPDTGLPAWVVRADGFGNPMVLTVNGKLPKPFVDNDGDGLPDVDKDGTPVDIHGNPISIPPFALAGEDPVPRDTYGRALTKTGGSPLYDYVDFKRTAMGAAVRTLREMVAAGVTEEADFDRIVDWAAQSLGYPEAPGVLGKDQRFSAKRFPFIDQAVNLLYSITATARYPEMDKLSRGIAMLGKDSCRVEKDDGTETCQSAVADAAKVMGDAWDLLSGSGAKLEKHNSLADELLPMIREMLAAPAPVSSGRADLLEAVLAVFSDSGRLGLGPSLATMMKYRDRDLKKPVDPSTYHADAGPDEYKDRSTLQRFLHLISDSNGAVYQPDLSFFPGLPEFKIENLAAFYIDALGCNATVPLIFKTVVQVLADDTLNECAYKNPDNPPSQADFPMYISARQLNRFITADNFCGNPTGREGKELRSFNGDTLFAFENSGAATAFKPVAQVFSSVGKSKLLADILSLLHAHFSKYNQGLDIPGRENGNRVVANLRPLEPTLVKLLDDGPDDLDMLGRAWPAFKALTLVDLSDEGGTGDLYTELVSFLDYLTDPVQFDATRDNSPGDLPNGMAIPKAMDGVTLIQPGKVTHLHALVQAMSELDDAYDSTKQVVKDDFKRILDLLIDRFLFEGWQDMDRGERAGSLINKLLGSCMNLVADEVESRIEQGIYFSNLDETLEDLETLADDTRDFIEGRTLAAGMRFLVQARRDSQLRNLFRGLFNYLAEPRAKEDEPFYARDAYTNLGRLVTALMELKAMGRSRQAIAGTLDIISKILTEYRQELLSMLDDLDTSIEANSVLIGDRGKKGRKTLFVAIRNLFAPSAELTEYPFETLGKTLKVLAREDPLQADSDLGPRDLYRMLNKALDYLQDEHHGIERLYSIICERKRGYMDRDDPCGDWL
ncbi:MAG: hypothetical protein GXP49_00895 [Deltaproteobacteria bacterium]|nr:hypothetical protein [Deltaproteobacteria bacterium]